MLTRGMEAVRCLLLLCLPLYLLGVGGCGVMVGGNESLGESEAGRAGPGGSTGVNAGALMLDVGRGGLTNESEIAGTALYALDADAYGRPESGMDREPNDTFDLAVKVPAAGQVVLTIDGRIDRLNDVDVFDLGDLAVGDVVTVELVRVDDRFRPSLALFDARRTALFVVNDPYPASGPSVFQLVEAPVRRSGRNHYLAVAAHPEQAGTGAYRFDLRIDPTGVVFPGEPQQVLLEFAGGVLPHAIFGVDEVAPFNVETIAPEYAGQEAAVRASLLDTLARNFRGLDITWVTSESIDQVPGDEYTTLYFGSTHPTLLGAANGVDEFNEDRADSAVVFTERFAPATFGFLPSAEELGRAMGNVASHELGHLLGLYHVQGEQAVMNQTSRAHNLIVDQELSIAPLSERVFLIGMQDARLRLAETVGER